MFTLEQIDHANKKIKTAADFPKFIKEIKKIGVIAFETWVADAHTVYFGKANFILQSPALYPTIPISSKLNKEYFISELKAHQQGKTDFFVFCESCAAFGIIKWKVDLEAFTCIYLDSMDNEVLVEVIQI